jgi:hypothetical protein
MNQIWRQGKMIAHFGEVQAIAYAQPVPDDCVQVEVQSHARLVPDVTVQAEAAAFLGYKNGLDGGVAKTSEHDVVGVLPWLAAVIA